MPARANFQNRNQAIENLINPKKKCTKKDNHREITHKNFFKATTLEKFWFEKKL